MPEVHAKLSPSSGERWINCTGSFDLIDRMNVPGPHGSFAAAEGTLAHSVLENDMLLMLGRRSHIDHLGERNRLGAQARELLGSSSTVEMSEYARWHIDLVQDLMMQVHGEATVFIEELVFPGIPDCFGTADTIVATDKTLHVVDYKYGRGIPVSAVQNTQLKLYGLGAYEMLKVLYDFEDVQLHIVQPRLSSVSTWGLELEELLAWRSEVVLPAVEKIRSGTGILKPEKKICQWCPAKAVCPARAEKMINHVFGELLEVI